MQIWTHSAQLGWQRWSHAGPGLDAVANASPAVDQVFLVGSGPGDDEALLASIRLIRRLARDQVTVIAGTDHPSACWRATVREAGSDRAVVVRDPSERSRHELPPLDDAVELGDTLCSELHVRHQQQGTLSVCGRHKDRMILARHHFDRWCLAGREECPHWLGGRRGWTEGDALASPNR